MKKEEFEQKAKRLNEVVKYLGKPYKDKYLSFNLKSNKFEKEIYFYMVGFSLERENELKKEYKSLKKEIKEYLKSL